MTTNRQAIAQTLAVVKSLATEPAQPHDLLSRLAPPVDFVDYLERLWAGRQPPAHWLEWLKTWQDIRSDQPSSIDDATPGQWAAAGERVRGSDTPR